MAPAGIVAAFSTWETELIRPWSWGGVQCNRSVMSATLPSAIPKLTENTPMANRAMEEVDCVAGSSRDAGAVNAKAAVATLPSP